MSYFYTDEEWAAVQPIYKTRIRKIGGTLLVGTYLCLAGLLAFNGFLLRKLWHMDTSSNRKVEDDD